MACIIDSEMNYKWINFYWLSAVVGEKKILKIINRNLAVLFYLEIFSIFMRLKLQFQHLVSYFVNFVNFVKHFANHSLVITHLPDIITRSLFIEEGNSNHWRYWEKMWSINKCSIISVSALQLPHRWLFYLKVTSTKKIFFAIK